MNLIRSAMPHSSFAWCAAHIRSGYFTALILLAATLPLSTVAQDTSHAPFDHQHTLLDQVLQEHVKQGLVNYRALKATPQTLDRYLRTLAMIDPESYARWTRQEKLALWINAYNAYTLRAILDHYPIQRSLLADPLRQHPADSIQQIPGVWSRLRWPVMGREYTLDYMEHTILRKQLREPRVHFVLVCASMGCPLLENHAFGATHLEARLEQAAHNYLYRDNKIQIDARVKRVHLPQIFKWFAEDFTVLPESARYVARFPADIAGPLTWVYRYANPQDRNYLSHGDFQVDYLDYDWALNESH
jgi:hypothetical protein